MYYIEFRDLMFMLLVFSFSGHQGSRENRFPGTMYTGMLVWLTPQILSGTNQYLRLIFTFYMCKRTLSYCQGYTQSRAVNSCEIKN